MMQHAHKIAECRDQIGPRGTRGVVAEDTRLHRSSSVGYRKVIDLKSAGPVLFRKANVVFWYLWSFRDNSGDQQES